MCKTYLHLLFYMDRLKYYEKKPAENSIGNDFFRIVSHAHFLPFLYPFSIFISVTPLSVLHSNPFNLYEK